MPIYEYKCRSCKREFEQRVSINEYSKHVPCDKCGGKTEKKISKTSEPVFSGSGFTKKFYK